VDSDRVRAAERGPAIGLTPGAGDAGSARRTVLDGEVVDYRLLRGRRRTIGMTIDLSGLTVRAPRWVTLRDIEAVLAERAAWILKSLRRWRERRRDVLPREWVSGATLLFRGEALTLDVYPAREKSIAVDLFHFRVLHPAAYDERQVARHVESWLREEALRLLAPLVSELAVRVAGAPVPVRISNARGAWGSCTHARVIRLNWRLIQLPDALARYVVAHEVAHLVEMNHSPRFWTAVEALYPGYKAARRALDEWAALLEA
jgi:predicted metal-dependent hydrolase